MKISVLLFFVIIFSVPVFCQLSYRQLHKDYLANDFELYKPLKKKKDTLSDLGWKMGVDFGFLFANKYTANFYNGSGRNSIRRTIVDNRINYNQIRSVLKYDFFLDSANLPTNMKYDPALNIGFYAKYNFNKHIGFSIDFNYSRLKASDFVTLIIENPSNLTSQPTYYKANILGTEDRINMSAGIYASFGKPSIVNPYVEAGFNLNNAKVKDSKVLVESLQYSIIDPTDQYYKVQQGGVGYGAYLGAGFKLAFSQAFAFNIGGTVYYSRINLGEVKAFKPQLALYLRMLVKSSVSLSTE